jgi:hypothetical protein
MLDSKTKQLMDKCNKAWHVVAEILDEDSTTIPDGFNLMLTLNARYLNGVSRWPEEAKLAKKVLKEEYIKLLEEKLG